MIKEIPMQIADVKAYFASLQKSLCEEFAAEDSKQFEKHPWQREGFGYGTTRVLEQGSIIERGGVNFSHVFGSQLPPSASVRRPDLAGSSFQALGISVVIHPRNPYAPTSHANLRLFVTGENEERPLWWFGGGFDLTPYYGFTEDCQYWHSMAKDACEPFGADIYPRFKKWCDEYFFIKHRNEPRGIGGIFFDDLNEWDFEHCFAFIKNIGDAYRKAYRTILYQRKDTPYGEKERQFQLYRRGRYVEFNLVYDRGTLFGLQSQGRAESILMSLPPHVTWQYDYHPEPDSAEARLYNEFLIAKEWV